MKKPPVSVIFSTYNQIEWLEKVIWGFEQQNFKNFEVVIADDGSTDKTKELISYYQKRSNLSIQHVWQPDQGFQKTQILNKAILKSQGDYLIFTDGDCIPRADFVSQHLQYRKKNSFLSGGYFKLPLSLSQTITHKNIIKQECFELNWLKKHGLKSSPKNLKLLSSSNPLLKILNKITTTTPSWNGHNASTWKALALQVNGFDQRMQYGGEDREFGERLVNLGVQPIQIRYFAICLHLDHPRGYVNQQAIDKNLQIRRITKKTKITKTRFGIQRVNN